MRQNLHVAHVVLSLDLGGLERNVINQIREGQKLGQTVSVVCVERPGILAPKAQTLGATVLCLDKQPGLRLGTIGRMRRALGDLRPDVVHTHQIGPLFYTGPAALSLGVPLVVHTEHGRVNYGGSFRTRWLGRLASCFVQKFYCLTKDMAEAVAAQHIMPRRKLCVIENGIAVDDYTQPQDTSSVRRSLGIPANARVIGTVGRLAEVKRQDVLLRAFAKVKSRASDVHLLLVGDGPLRSKLSELAEELGISQSTHFAGYQEWSAPFLQTMTVFALTSRSEGMPQAVLEASVAGLPVVASRVGGLPELIEHERTGLLVEAGNVDAVADGLLSLLSSPARAQELGRAAHDKVVARFHICRMAAEYHRDFLELLRLRRAG